MNLEMLTPGKNRLAQGDNSFGRTAGVFLMDGVNVEIVNNRIIVLIRRIAHR
jgi:hypothetical protein